MYVMDRSADQDLEARMVAMDQGLVVEFCCEDDTVVRDYDETPTVECLQIANPVTNSHLSWFLDPPFPERPRNNELPTLVVAADRASSIFSALSNDQYWSIFTIHVFLPIIHVHRR